MISLLKHHESKSYALINASTQETVSYGELIANVEHTAYSLARLVSRPLVFLCATNTIDAIQIYLACLSADFAVCLIEPESNVLHKLVAIYQPHIVCLPAGFTQLINYDYCSQSLRGEYHFFCNKQAKAIDANLHRSLSLLLTTSGSTGNPKLVRLSQQNVLANAQSIAQYLKLSPKERAIQSLPFHYSYGLSIINSHLVVGGSILLTENSFMRPEFWRDFDSAKCTSFAGVPYMYETLHRLKFEPTRHSSLRTMTQAGGGLRPDLIDTFRIKALQASCDFYVMYGQTEATARISYVPPESLETKIGSIGIPIPNGQLQLRSVNSADSELFELIYHGPNVMLGYAETLADLDRGDEQHGTLATGDLAKVDDDGYFYLLGRLKRIAKLFGKRINLNDIETLLETEYPVRAIAVDSDNQLTVFAELLQEIDLHSLETHLAKFLNVTPRAIIVQRIDKLPVTSSGKKDYKAFTQG